MYSFSKITSTSKILNSKDNIFSGISNSIDNLNENISNITQTVKNITTFFSNLGEFFKNLTYLISHPDVLFNLIQPWLTLLILLLVMLRIIGFNTVKWIRLSFIILFIAIIF